MNESEKKNHDEKNLTDERRRDFLRKSVYAAYATPVIMSMLVEKASAAQTWNPGKGVIPDNNSPDKDPVGWLGNDNG